ncbi:MAG: alpha/beta-type small acid-soluble spore protein [Thermaerobacter sp.]|nr:alpha/beta-type small acid-soluble spore protein [Thermaerobacter sp.]
MPDRESDASQREEAMEDLKLEVADDVDVPLEEDGDNGDLTARQLGKVGGNMVKRLVQRGEQALADDAAEDGTAD